MNPSYSRVLFLKANKKKIIIEKKDVKNKKRKHRSELDLANMQASKISQLHMATGDALHDSVRVIEAENAKLKDRIKELEEALFPMPLLGSPLAIAIPSTPCTPATNLKGSSSFLHPVEDMWRKISTEEWN
jgi:hypothetical protein